MTVAYAYFLLLVILSYWFGEAASSMYVKYGEFFFHVIPKHY